MRYFFDTEFIEDGRTIDLISIGIVAEDGRKYYAVSTEFKARRADRWVKDNVLVHLPPRHVHYSDSPRLREEALAWKNRQTIKRDILEFCDQGKPEFWAYYADYDWVVFCQLFGRMIDLPKGFPMYCRDIKQWADQLGVELPKQESTEHHALADAQWNFEAWRHLNSIVGARTQ